MAGKKPEFKTKKFYYRRAKWDDQGVLSLEQILKAAHENLDTVGKRTFKAGTGAEIRGANFKEDDGGGLKYQAQRVDQCLAESGCSRLSSMALNTARGEAKL